MELFDVPSDFLSDKPEMKHLLPVIYLANIFEKLNMLNKLQGTNKTLTDSKAKIFWRYCIYRVMSKTYFIQKL